MLNVTLIVFTSDEEETSESLKVEKLKEHLRKQVQELFNSKYSKHLQLLSLKEKPGLHDNCAKFSKKKCFKMSYNLY